MGRDVVAVAIVVNVALRFEMCKWEILALAMWSKWSTRCCLRHSRDSWLPHHALPLFSSHALTTKH